MLDVVVAYLDPGTGATLMQLFLAGTAGVAAAAKMRFRRNKAATAKQDGIDTASADEATARVEESDTNR